MRIQVDAQHDVSTPRPNRPGSNHGSPGGASSINAQKSETGLENSLDSDPFRSLNLPAIPAIETRRAHIPLRKGEMPEIAPISRDVESIPEKIRHYTEHGPQKNKSGGYWYHGSHYASCPEAACSVLMEKYIPGYKNVPHKTFQIPVYDFKTGTTCTIDFLVNGVFLEYHPPRFWKMGKTYGDFNSAGEYFRYRKALGAKETPEEKREYRETTQRKLQDRYQTERREIVAGNPDYASIPLVVAGSPAEFYDKILARFGSNLPPREEFLSDFRSLTNEIRAKNKTLKLQEQQKTQSRK